MSTRSSSPVVSTPLPIASSQNDKLPIAGEQEIVQSGEFYNQSKMPLNMTPSDQNMQRMMANQMVSAPEMIRYNHQMSMQNGMMQHQRAMQMQAQMPVNIPMSMQMQQQHMMNNKMLYQTGQPKKPHSGVAFDPEKWTNDTMSKLRNTYAKLPEEPSEAKISEVNDSIESVAPEISKKSVTIKEEANEYKEFNELVPVSSKNGEKPTLEVIKYGVFSPEEVSTLDSGFLEFQTDNEEQIKQIEIDTSRHVEKNIAWKGPKKQGSFKPEVNIIITMIEVMTIPKAEVGMHHSLNLMKIEIEGFHGHLIVRIIPQFPRLYYQKLRTIASSAHPDEMSEVLIPFFMHETMGITGKNVLVRTNDGRQEQAGNKCYSCGTFVFKKKI